MAITATLTPRAHVPAPKKTGRRAGSRIVKLKAVPSPMPQDEVLDERQMADQRWSGWMAAAQSGDRAAYNSLLREIVPMIQRIARRQGVEGDHVDDVVQEVLTSIHKARHTYDPSRSFAAWLTTISQRRAIDILRRTSRHSKRERHAPLAYESYAEPDMQPDRPRDEADRARMLGEAIGDLSDGQREAVEHLAIRELSLAETARLTGKSKGALKVNLHRAMKTLRARLGGKL
ncbi:MAG: sigma-70 family RNA polymerase sigma factor [Parvibaculum sp.]